MTGLGRFFPWIVVGIVALYLVLLLLPPTTSDGAMNLYEFGQLPVQSGGRIKPLDSVARTTLLIVSNRQSWRDENNNVRPAIEWLLDAATSQLEKKRNEEDADKKGAIPHPPVAETRPLFRVENDQLLTLLDLKARPGNYRYSIAEMSPRFAEFDDKARRAGNKEPTERDLLERKVLELRRHLEMYLELAQWHEPRMVPPRDDSPHWRPFLEAVALERSSREENKAVRHLGAMLLAYTGKETKKFNAALEDYKDYLAKNHPDAVSAAGFEAAFNHFEPFYQCSILYALAFLLTCIGWLVWREPLRVTAFWLVVLVLIVHTGALLARIWISGRPPVTNLYSSAVFIGWGTVILGLILERVFPLGVGNFVSTVCGSATVLIAHFLGTSGDTLDVLQAVLDTNFWLATHVTCITFGYAATYVAGLLGMVYITLGVATPLLTRELGKTIGQAMYGVVCFAMFLSFTGTVLGGIWADQSWGRFWGWDPKENGALLIVLINALVLHARWGGMVKERGMAVLNIVGNIVTTWSWFGVNNLGVGLHSYGFMEGAVYAILTASLVFLAFIGAGALVPRQMWVSENTAPPPVARGRSRTR